MRRKITTILLLFIVGISYGVPTIHKKLPLKILYVGYSPEKERPIYNEREVGFYPKDFFYKEIESRMNEFKTLLEEYFQSVTTLDVREYKQDVSKEYDVTIFDALPAPIIKAEDLRDNKGNYIKTLLPQYLDSNFDSPTLFIGHTGGVMRNRLDLKIDWYCLCLNSHALQCNTKHKIFHDPFQTPITKELRKTPQQALGYLSGQQLPEQMPMWRVQKAGYREGKQNRVGLVSSGEPFKEGPDSEYISGGESLKSIDAAAIARHANFFLWGFAASPSGMTEEARIVFINSVAYISEFKGNRIVVRKNEAGGTQRSYVDHLLNLLATKEGAAVEKFLSPELLTLYKKDAVACRKQIRADRPYFYGFGTYEQFVIDKEAQQMGVANNNPKILDKAISLLEKDSTNTLAKRILERYTTEKFNTAEKWREWYHKNRKTMFFSEVAGYVFITPSSITKKEYSTERESHDPATVTTTFFSKNEKKFIKISVELEEDYHIYAMEENGNSPFFATKIAFDEAVKPHGTILRPQAILYDSESKIYIYKGRIEFIQEYTGTIMDKIGTISFQCCNSKVCLEPVTISLK